MPTNRLDQLFADIHNTLDQIDRQLRRLFWVLLYVLTMTIIIFTKVFSF